MKNNYTTQEACLGMQSCLERHETHCLMRDVVVISNVWIKENILIVWQHQTIIWMDIDLPSTRLTGIHSSMLSTYTLKRKTNVIAWLYMYC